VRYVQKHDIMELIDAPSEFAKHPSARTMVTLSFSIPRSQPLLKTA
jgi:hypothetical protein